MRALILPAVALALAGAVVLVGGRMVERPLAVEPVALDQPSAEDLAALGEPAAPMASEPGRLQPRRPPVGSRRSRTCLLRRPLSRRACSRKPRQVPSCHRKPPPNRQNRRPLRAWLRPTVVAPPDLAAEELQREAPREPLSKLSLALPPVPEVKNKWAGTPFFRPLAIESAVFESMGRTIAVAGVESVPLDESCVYEGTSWPCGVRARTAFRLWLRGRALVCQLPDEEHEVTRARCRLAKQDAGSWLVANGWARAAPDGPYVVAEEKARAAKIGIFGAPPDASAISDVPDAPAGTSGKSSKS